MLPSFLCRLCLSDKCRRHPGSDNLHPRGLHCLFYLDGLCPLKDFYLLFSMDDVYPLKESYRFILFLFIYLFVWMMYIHLRNLIVSFFRLDDVHPLKESYRLSFFLEEGTIGVYKLLDNARK